MHNEENPLVLCFSCMTVIKPLLLAVLVFYFNTEGVKVFPIFMNFL